MRVSVWLREDIADIESTENFPSSDCIINLLTQKLAEIRVGKDNVEIELFSTISYVSHTEKSIRNPDADDPEPKDPFGSDPKIQWIRTKNGGGSVLREDINM